MPVSFCKLTFQTQHYRYITGLHNLHCAPVRLSPKRFSQRVFSRRVLRAHFLHTLPDTGFYQHGAHTIARLGLGFLPLNFLTHAEAQLRLHCQPWAAESTTQGQRTQHRGRENHRAPEFTCFQRKRRLQASCLCELCWPKCNTLQSLSGFLKLPQELASYIFK